MPKKKIILAILFVLIGFTGCATAPSDDGVERKRVCKTDTAGTGSKLRKKSCRYVIVDPSNG